MIEEEKWTLEIELVIDEEYHSDEEDSSTLKILNFTDPQVEDNANATQVTLKLQDIMKCYVVLARCSVIVVIDGMPFITIVSIFSDRRTPPIAERQHRALLLVAYLSSVHIVVFVFVFRIFIVDYSCNTGASILDHNTPERER